ncbi:MAG: hypothetical protein A2157_19935 [Deltaproteobacteria bacterium RBG_16_47_11]|nr:MAG: hypothetical protein A2157_19935 [Deltaproteobacteria bacterium RBG_16_47_11]
MAETTGQSIRAGALPAWRVGELPEAPKRGFRSFLQMIGPGAIMLSLSIGSGEWLMGPAAAVQYGPMLMWITTIACITQTFFNLECIRYAVYCGEPMMIGYNRLKPGRGLWGPIWIITCVVCIGPGWAITSATAWTAILINKMPDAADKTTVMVWGIIITAIVLFILLWGRKVENTLEKISWAIVAFIVGSLIILIIGWVPGEAIWKVTKGFFSFGSIPEGADPVLLGGFAAYSAAGGIFNISSSNWFRDKGYGMGKQVGFISGAIGGEKIAVAPLGIAFKPTAENLKRWKEWLHFARLDQWILFGFGCWLGMWLTVTFAVGMIPQGTKVAGWAVAAYQGNAIRNFLGTPGWVWVQLIGFWVLFGTQLGVTDSATRQMADMMYNMFPNLRKFIKEDIRVLYYIIFALVVLWVIMMVSVVKLPLTFILIQANIAGFVFVYGGIQTLVVNNKFLPKAIRPNWFENLMVMCMIVFYGFFTFFAMRKAFGTVGWVILFAFYVLVLILAIVDFAKTKEEGYPE